MDGFSKGMSQKVAIARALLHEPEVIYLNEPNSALDPSAAKNIRDFVSGLGDAGRSIVICTHNLDEAERLCDRIGIIRQTLIQVNSPAALRRYGRLATVHVQLAASDGEARRLLEALAPLPFVMGAREHEGTLQVEVRDPRRDNPELVSTLVAHGARIVGVREEAASLEDVYLDMVGETNGREGT